MLFPVACPNEVSPSSVPSLPAPFIAPPIIVPPAIPPNVPLAVSCNISNNVLSSSSLSFVKLVATSLDKESMAPDKPPSIEDSTKNEPALTANCFPVDNATFSVVSCINVSAPVTAADFTTVVSSASIPAAFITALPAEPAKPLENTPIAPLAAPVARS